MEFTDKTFLVYGDGLSGRAAADFIKKRGGAVAVYSDDGGEFSVPKTRGYSAAVIAPGISPSHGIYEYCAAHGIPVTSEVELGLNAAYAENATIIGITGTNGKTTTTTLTAAMTGGTACGNIGYPVTNAAETGARTLVCELSSFQLAGAVLPVTVGVIVNIGEDHINWHGTIENYRAAKCNIARRAKTLVLGGDIPVCALKTLKTSARILYVSDKPVDGAYISGGNIWFCDEKIIPLDYLRLRGRHNEQNALCAVAAAKAVGADNSAIISALSSATAAPHRLEYVREAAGKKWIDDSKSTNIASTLAAAEATDGEICLILGGRDKSLDFSALFSSLPERVREIIAMGECAQKIAAAGEAAGKKTELAQNLEGAVRIAAKSVCETVLLSPACASFDEFGGYAERGDAFKKLVEGLGEEK